MKLKSCVSIGKKCIKRFFDKSLSCIKGEEFIGRTNINILSNLFKDAGVQFKIANKYAFFYCEIIFPRGVKENIRSTITMLANTLVSVQKAIVDR